MRVRLQSFTRSTIIFFSLFVVLVNSELVAQPYPHSGQQFTLRYLGRSHGSFAPDDRLQLLYVFDFWNVRYGTRLALWNNVLRPDTTRLKKAAMTRVQDGWEAVIDIPADAALLSYVVSNGKSIDGNDEQTYVEYVRNAADEPVKNARFFNVQFMRLARREMGVLLNEAGLEISAYPDNFPAYHQYFSIMLEQDKGSARSQQRIIQKIDELEKSYSTDPEFLNMAARTYYYLLQDPETALSYRAKIPVEKLWPEVMRIFDRDARNEEQQERNDRMQGIRDKLSNAPLPEFQLRSYDGGKVNFPGKGGKPSILCFWMEGSEKSRNMLRDLAAFHGRFGERIDIVAVCVDRDQDRTVAYLKQHPLPFTALHNQGNTLFKLGVESVPTTFIVDKDNIVYDAYVGYSANVTGALQQAIESLLGAR